MFTSLPRLAGIELRGVDHCPLCGGQDWRAAAPAEPNLYAEQIARLLACSESELLNTLTNRQCIRCGLYSKAKWLPSALIQQVFTQVVPSHPKGWDAASPRFTPAGFQAEIAQYALALANADQGEIARHRRSLTSIVDSLIEIAGSPMADALHAAILAGDTTVLRAAEPSLAQLQWRPWPYKRFSGFADPALWQWLQAALGPIYRYGEVGCPLWGFLNRRPHSGGAWFRVERAEPNYWSHGCRAGGVHCSERLHSAGDTQRMVFGDPHSPRLDLLGAFQYLDHLEQPLDFLAQALRQARALALILDAGDLPTAVQHYTGWNAQSLQFAAERLGATLIMGFEPIRASGNVLYLLIGPNAQR